MSDLDIEQLKQIAERWNNTEARPTDVIPVMKALPDLLIALEAAERELADISPKFKHTLRVNGELIARCERAEREAEHMTAIAVSIAPGFHDTFADITAQRDAALAECERLSAERNRGHGALYRIAHALGWPGPQPSPVASDDLTANCVAQVVAGLRERDEMRTIIAGRFPSEVTTHNVERDTAEAIAAWLEDPDKMPSETELIVAGEIRSNAWKAGKRWAG